MEGVKKKKKLLRAISLSSLRSLFLRLSFSLSSFPITLSPALDHSPAFFVASSLLLSPALFLPAYLSLCVFLSSLLRCRSVYKLASRASLDSQPAIRFTIVAFCFSFASLEDFLFCQSRLRSSAIVSCTFNRKHFLGEIIISIFVKKNV